MSTQLEPVMETCLRLQTQHRARLSQECLASSFGASFNSAQLNPTFCYLALRCLAVGGNQLYIRQPAATASLRVVLRTVQE